MMEKRFNQCVMRNVTMLLCLIALALTIWIAFLSLYLVQLIVACGVYVRVCSVFTDVKDLSINALLKRRNCNILIWSVQELLLVTLPNSIGLTDSDWHWWSPSWWTVSGMDQIFLSASMSPWMSVWIQNSMQSIWHTFRECLAAWIHTLIYKIDLSLSIVLLFLIITIHIISKSIFII